MTDKLRHLALAAAAGVIGASVGLYLERRDPRR